MEMITIGLMRIAYAIHANRWHHVRKTTNYIDTIKDPLQIANLCLGLPLACWGSKVRP